jgi:hypothetical protein
MAKWVGTYWMIFCARCGYRAHATCEALEIQFHIAGGCPKCARVGLDAVAGVAPPATRGPE